MPDLLVTGSYGQLGRAVLAAAAERGLSAEGHDQDTLDIASAAAVLECVERTRPGAVVNCAAYTAVDACEADEALATLVNGTAVGHLAAACNAVGARLVHVSTDYVFAGDGRRPYREEDPTGPLSAYGRSKLVGEAEARRARRHLVARTAWLYGRGGRNFVETIRTQIEAGATRLRVVGDQLGSPTLGDDLAVALLDLLAAEAEGVVHVVNSGVTSWHGFATEIARGLGADVAVDEVTTAEFPRPAPRPAYSVLDTSRLTRLLGASLPTWQDGLRRYLASPCAP
jgi:dTDP-4-dehydrorhamnose reductase